MRSRKVVVAVLWVVLSLAMLGVGWQVGRTASRPPAVSISQASPVTTEVVKGSLSVEQPYPINVSWPAKPAFAAASGGVLTELHLSPAGTVVKPGQVLFSVDLSPTVAAVGSVPAFRPMAQGISGPDVAQLKAMLRSMGWEVSPGDRFDSSTAEAVSGWRKKLKVAEGAEVPLGMIAFFPVLPVTLAPSADVAVGITVAPGQALAAKASSEPTFSFKVLPESVKRTKQGMLVTMTHPSGTWSAQVDRLAPATDGSDLTTAVLKPVSGQSICLDQCTSVVQVGGAGVLPGSLQLIPAKTGSQVPTAAIRADANGRTCVILDSLRPRAVEVQASHEGRSIVTGVEPGQRVVVDGVGGRC